MYIHIGGDCSIPEKCILAIFDFDAVTQGENETINFLKKAEQEGRLETVSYEIPRSIIIAVDKVYISPISASTIRKRSEKILE